MHNDVYLQKKVLWTLVHTYLSLFSILVLRAILFYFFSLFRLYFFQCIYFTILFFCGRTHSHGSVTVRYRKDAKLYIIHDWDITAPNCKCSVEDGYFLHPLCQMENQKASVINIKICDNGKQLSHVYDFHRTWEIFD